MRLRLDKLVLSAGLALAMVATTIPVMPVKAAATTPGYYVGTTSSDAASIGAKVLETAGKVTRGTNIKITAGAQGTPAATAATALTGDAGDKVTLYRINNSCSSVELNDDSAPSKIVVTQPFTYSTNAESGIVVTISGDTNGTAAAEATETAAAVEEVAAVTTERDAAVDAVIAELNGLGIGTYTKGTVTGPVAGTGSYTVTVKYTAPTAATSKDYGTVAYSGGSDVSLTVSAVNTTTGEATITFDNITITNTYTITNLAALDASFKIVKSLDADTSETGSRQYTLLKVTADGEIEEVKTVLGASEASELVADVTDLTCVYYIATKTVSTSDILIASAEDDATYTGAIEQIASTDLGATAAEKLAEAIEANSAKLVAYLNVTAKNTSTNEPVDETANELTFKIAVPADVDTTGVVFKVLRYHGSSVDVLDTTVSDGYIYFTSNKFSTYALVTVAADTTTTDTTEEATDSTTDSATDSTTDATTDSTSATTADSSTTSTTASKNTGDNSMMPLFMTTLLLALCAGSLAIYKEKKTN